ncbi:MAG: phosphoribosylglycinamide formyltransferase, partial [Acidimicrobiales bacterium]
GSAGVSTGPALAVLVSGSGTIMEAILGADLPVVVVIADRSCRAIELARDAGVSAEVVERGDWGPGFDRDAFTERILDALKRYQADVVAMAGFGTVLGDAMFDTYGGRVLNTHPALLPDFKGWHAVADVLAAGVSVTGCTVHVATREVDDGPILAAEPVEVLPGDTEATLHERIKEVERRLYPETIRTFLQNLDAS